MVKEADQIIVLEEGKIAGIGTHEELLNDCAIYREIVSSQFSEEDRLSTEHRHSIPPLGPTRGRRIKGLSMPLKSKILREPSSGCWGI